MPSERRRPSSAGDVSIVGLAVAASARAVDARYAAARATLSSMTGEWEDSENGARTRRRGNNEDGKTKTKTKKKGGGGMTPEDVRADAVKKAVSHERRMAASAAREGASSSSSASSSAGEALRSKANGFFFSEVRAGVDELSRETSKAKAEARSRTASANRGNAKKTTTAAKASVKAVVKTSKEDARATVNDEKKKKRPEPVKTKPNVEEKKPMEKKKQRQQRPQRPQRRASKSDDVDKDEDGFPTGVVVELAKFALPALLTWLVNRKKIKDLTGNLETMTQAKVRAALEATKLRQEVVDLRHDLDLAERDAEDIQQASEQLMQRRNSVKEVKMKHMAVDHIDQMRKVRENAQKEINEAKALEVGARWREEACRRMKNRATAEAEELRKKIEELEAKIKRIEDNQREERVEAVKSTVQNVAKNFVRMASKIARKEEPKVDEAPAEPAPEPAPEPEQQDAGGKKKKSKKKNKQ